MQYIVNKGEKGKVEIKVTVPAKDFDERYQQILKTSAAEAKIEGFRPGKAPLDVVEGRVGANKLLNETANYLVGVKLSEILKKENLSPIDSPRLAIDSLEKGKEFAFLVTFTQKPKVTVGDWKKIKVKKIAAKKITDKEIDESVKNIFEAWKKSKEQETGNRKQETGEEEAVQEQKKFIYDARGNKIFIDEKKEPDKPGDTPGVKSGSHPGDTPGVSKEPFDQTQGKPFDGTQGKPDDDFAKAVGAQSLAHLKELVQKDLEALVADQVETKYEQEIFAQLRKLGEVTIPDVLVDDEVNRILIRISTELERQGKDLKKYIEEQNTTIDALKAQWRKQAEENVITSLILQEIGISEKIQVTPEEMESSMKGVGEQKLTDEQKKDLENYVAYNIFQAKTVDLIKKTISA